MASRSLTRSAISPSPRTAVRFSNCGTGRPLRSKFLSYEIHGHGGRFKSHANGLTPFGRKHVKEVHIVRYSNLLPSMVQVGLRLLRAWGCCVVAHFFCRDGALETAQSSAASRMSAPEMWEPAPAAAVP